MRTLPTALIEELNKVAENVSFITYLLSLDTNPPVNIVKADVSVYYDNKIFESKGIDFGAFESSISSQVDKLSVDIDNVDLVMSALIMGSEIRGKSATLKLVALDTNMVVIGESLLFSGIIDSAKANKRTASFELLNHMILWKKKIPRRTSSVTCPWSFKDPDTCRYVGAFTTCDKSWDNCTQRSNTINFGGHPYIASLVDKSIWWGSSPS